MCVCRLYQAYGGRNPVNFANWLILGLPLSFICFLFCWFWMQLYGQGLRSAPLPHLPFY